MTRISPYLLNDTLSLVQLARETALAHGKQAQAERLTPVAENLRTLVSNSRQSQQTAPAAGIMAQSDFQTILAALGGGAQTAAPASVQNSSQGSSIQSMAANTQSTTTPANVTNTTVKAYSSLQTNSGINSSLERNQVVSAMSAAGMADVDIARQMGMARDEVHLILLSANRGSRYASEVNK
jgi:hypothetical protein